MGAILESQARKDWNGSARIRSEFREFENYLAYLKYESEGQVTGIQHINSRNIPKSESQAKSMWENNVDNCQQEFMCFEDFWAFHKDDGSFNIRIAGRRI